MPLQANGKFNKTVVDGLSRTGLQAADGSMNVVVDDVTSKGVYHPCGAVRMNSGTGQAQDPSGAIYSNRFN